MRVYYKLVFFFNDTATTEIYTLSLHDALPIYRLRRRDHAARRDLGRADGRRARGPGRRLGAADAALAGAPAARDRLRRRSEEHTSELQSRQYLGFRLLLEKKKHIQIHPQLHIR